MAGGLAAGKEADPVKPVITFSCSVCGAPKTLFKSEYENRKRVNKSPPAYCSKKCASLGARLRNKNEKAGNQNGTEHKKFY